MTGILENLSLVSPTDMVNTAKNFLSESTADSFSEEEMVEREKRRIQLEDGIKEVNNSQTGMVDNTNRPILVNELLEDPENEWWNSEQGKQSKRRLKIYRGYLKGKYETTYQELPRNKKWVHSIRSIYEAENGKEFEGTDYQLTENYFEKFNSFANRITSTTFKGLNDNFFFSDFDENNLRLTTAAYDIFHKTDMSGDGSRPLYEQSKDFLIQSGTDPATILSLYMTGGLAKLGTSAIAPLVMKEMVKGQISKRALLASSSFTSALVGGNIDANLQMVNQRLAGQEEINIDKSQVLTTSLISGAIPSVLQGTSAALTPVINKIPIVPFIDSLAQVPQKIMTAAGTPIKSFYKNRIKGEGAAAFNMLENLQTKIIRTSKDSSKNDMSTILVDGVLNPANKTIQNGFNSLKYIDMPVSAQAKLRNIIASHKIKNPNAILDPEVERLLLTMYDEKALNKYIKNNNLGLVNVNKLPNAQIPGSLKGSNSATTFSELKQAIWDARQLAVKEGNGGIGKQFMELYNKINDVQVMSLANPGEKVLWSSLNKANSEFNLIMETNEVGKFFPRIKELKDKASTFSKNGNQSSAQELLGEADKVSGQLLNYLLHDKNALINLKQLKLGLDKVDEIGGNVKNAINASNNADRRLNFKRAEKNQTQMEIRPDIKESPTANSYNQILKTVKDELGTYLEQESVKGQGIAYAALDQLTSKRDGFKMLKLLFPENAKFYDDLAVIKKVLQGRVEKKSGQSVIINMTVARMAGDLGGNVGGKFGSMAAPIASVPILAKFREELGNPAWQKAMLDTVKNEGRVPTWFKSFLKASGNKTQKILGVSNKNAWTDKQVADLVEEWAVMFQGTVIVKNKENIDEEIRDEDGEDSLISGLSLKDLYMGGQSMFESATQ